MQGLYKAVKLTDRVYWVGAIDWTIRDFHGYTTKRGSTYNAYLILADKITLIDTVKAPFKDELLARIASVVNPEYIDVIVSNHSEMDHSGCLGEIIDLIKPEKVYASAMGVKTLKELFHFNTAITPVKDGETVSLGNRNLSFMETRMLHWPDSMISYLCEEEILFSQDAFGMHLATAERFADEIDPSILQYEGATYFANILLPYANLVAKLAERLAASGWTFRMVAPDHGPVWRKDISSIVAGYSRWAARKPKMQAVVVYGTMWHSTEEMARHIGEGLASEGAIVKLMSMDAFHRSDVAYEILDAGALVVGTSTLNNNMLPGMADILTYLKGLRPANLIGASFGSYGWSGEGAGQIMEVLKEMKIEMVGDVLRVKHRPDQEALAGCYALGESIGRELRNKVEA
jgi:flavorubredoxin